MARHVSEPVLVPWRLGFTLEQLRQLQMLGSVWQTQGVPGEQGKVLG